MSELKGNISSSGTSNFLNQRAPSVPEAPRLPQKEKMAEKAKAPTSKTAQEKKALTKSLDTKLSTQQTKIADNVRFSQDLTGPYKLQKRSAIIQRHFREEIEKHYLSFINHQPSKEELELAARFASSSIWDILKKAKTQDDDDDIATGLLAVLLKIHSEYTFEHSERVSDWTVALAEELGINDEQELRNLENAAFFKDIGMIGEAVGKEDEESRDELSNFLKNSRHFILECSALHDIGKMSIPQSIINKAAPLNDEEFSIIKTHPLIGVEIVKSIPILCKAIPGIRHHHEKYDGSGYPDKLGGESIPLAARIITVTDSFDAMIEDRPYRKALSPGDAVSELVRLSGKQFDPSLIKPFIKVLLKRGIVEANELDFSINLSLNLE